MPRLPLRKLTLLSLVFLGCLTGCSFFPESMQPHELWKLNRYKGPSTDPFFSRRSDDRDAKIIPTSYDRPALVTDRPLRNDRPQFDSSYAID